MNNETYGPEVTNVEYGKDYKSLQVKGTVEIVADLLPVTDSLPIFHEPIPMGAASHACPECLDHSKWSPGKPATKLMVVPKPLSNPDEGWIPYPCHQSECACCYRFGKACEGCGTVCQYGECDCSYCESCEVYIEDSLCGHCSYCESCCSCYVCDGCDQMVSEGHYCEQDDSHTSKSSLKPGWVTRGDSLPTDRYQGDVYAELTKEAATIDPVTAMTDFYLTDYVMAILSKPLVMQGPDYNYRDDYFRTAPLPMNSISLDADMSNPLLRDAKTLQDFYVAKLDSLFQDYVFAAIGGEVRHHANVRTDCPRDRNQQWDYWQVMGETIGREALSADAEALFNDSCWGGSYGGHAWATAAKVLKLRLSGRIDARTFVDRVFTLQHNSGSLLDKIAWRIDGNNYPAYCQTIGNAHSADHPDFDVLVESCSEDVRSLLTVLVGRFPNLLPNVDRQGLLSVLGLLP